MRTSQSEDTICALECILQALYVFDIGLDDLGTKLLQFYEISFSLDRQIVAYPRTNNTP